MSNAEPVVNEEGVDDPGENLEPDAPITPKGFLSKEDWVESGKAEEDWMSPAHYERFGGLIRQVTELKADARVRDNEHNELIAGQNLVHQTLRQQAEARIKDKEALLDEAIEASDTVEAKRHQSAIDADKEAIRRTPARPRQPAQQPSPTVVAWNAANPWIDTPGAKSTYAKAEFNAFQRANARQYGGNTEALFQAATQHVDAAVAREFKVTNPNREGAPATPRAGTTSTGGGKGKATMKNLTTDEKEVYQALKYRFKDKDGKASTTTFLKHIDSTREMLK